MTIKTATLIALIGISVGYAMSLLGSLGLHHSLPVYMLQSALYHIPLIIFLFTLYRKQQ